jgi:hypothetical protein
VALRKGKEWPIDVTVSAFIGMAPLPRYAVCSRVIRPRAPQIGRGFYFSAAAVALLARLDFGALLATRFYSAPFSKAFSMHNEHCADHER